MKSMELTEELISDNGISRVWREDDWIYKTQPKYLTDNEWYGLVKMYPSGFTPRCERLDIELVKIEYVEDEGVKSPRTFMHYYDLVLSAMREAGLRHGDLTEKAVLVRNNRPVIIDWAESRTWDDPRPDKRREGDAYWLKVTMEKLCQGI